MLRLVPKSIQDRLVGRDNLTKTLTNIAWLYADRALRLSIGLVVGVWLARYLGPSQFGLLSFALSLVGLFAAFTSLGLQNIVVRDVVSEPDDAGRTLGTAFVLQAVFGTVSCILVFVTIKMIRPEDALAIKIVAIIGSTLIFKASDVVRYWFESQVQSKYSVWVENGVMLITASTKIALIISGAPLSAFAWVVLAETVAVSITLAMVYARKLRSTRSWTVHLSRARELIGDGWPVILSGIAVAIYMKIDQVMIGYMIGDESVGIYSAAVRLSEFWYFIAIGIIASVVPTLIKTKTLSDEQFVSETQKLYDLMVLIALVVAIPFSFFAQEIVVLFFGDEYQSAGDVLAVHLWAAVFVFLGKASSNWFFVHNRQILILQRSLLGMITNIGLNALVIPKFGLLGAAWSTVLSYVMISFVYDAIQAETRCLFWMKVRAFNIIRSLRSLIRSSSNVD